MCGLVGIAGALGYKDEIAMKRLLLFDFLRGNDATGLAAIRSNGDAVISKINSDPIDLFGFKSFTDALNGNQSRAFIGHNRAATRGKNIQVNAHPFQFDHIVGAHNGTLTHKSVERLQDALKEKFDVDSMALFAGIAKLGVDEAIKLCTEGEKEHEGAWALTWFDQNEGTINFLRNKHRPLFFAYEEGFKRIFWASESWMMVQALKEFKIWADSKGYGYFVFKEDMHYKFDLAALTTKGQHPKPKVKALKGRDPEEDKPQSFGYHTPAVVTSGQSAYPFGRGGTEARTSGTHTTTATNQRSTSSTTNHGSTSKQSVIQLVGNDQHPYANLIDKVRFKAAFADGCSWCHAPVEFGDPGLIIYDRDSKIMCSACVGYSETINNPPVKIYIRDSVFNQLVS